MSQKSKMRKAAREAKQEKQAKKVIYWIFAVLILLGVCFLAFAMM